MSKKNFLNVFLLFVVIILANMIFHSEQTSSELEKLSRINIDLINRISIQRNNTTTTLLTKDSDKQWQISAPVHLAANNFRINSILKLLNSPVHKRYRAAEIDIDKIGLLTPKTVIRFNDIEIAFGITNPVTALRFVRIGDAISTIQDVYSPLLESHFSTLVSLNLLPVNPAAFSGIEKLILLNQTISKNSTGLWQSNIDISADNINKTLDHWQHDQAFGIHQYLQREQLGDIFIYTKQPDAVIHYQITDTDPWLILARPELGLEYHLDIEAYDNIIAPQ